MKSTSRRPMPLVTGCILFLLVLSHASNVNARGVNGCNNWLSLINAQSLSFGNIVAATAGNVTVDADGVRTSSGGVILTGGVVSAAIFDVTTRRHCHHHAFTITLPSSIILSSGSNNMSVNNFVTTVVPATLVTQQGSGQIRAGATLDVASNQPSGNYSGQFTIDVIFE